MRPHIINDIYGNPEWVAGNCRNVLGEYSLVKVHVSKLCYFAIIRQGNLLPVNPEASELIKSSYLRGGPLAKEDDAKITSLPSWLVPFNRSKLPQGNARSDESKSDLEYMEPCFKIWHTWLLKHLANERNDALQQVMEDFRIAGSYKRYVKPAESNREFDHSSMGSVFQASAVDHLEVTSSISWESRPNPKLATPSRAPSTSAVPPSFLKTHAKRRRR